MGDVDQKGRNPTYDDICIGHGSAPLYPRIMVTEREDHGPPLKLKLSKEWAPNGIHCTLAII